MCSRILKERGFGFWEYALDLDLERLRGGEADVKKTLKSLVDTAEDLDTVIIPAGDSAFEPCVGENDSDDDEPMSLGQRKENVKYHIQHLTKLYAPVNVYPLIALLNESDEKDTHMNNESDSDGKSKREDQALDGEDSVAPVAQEDHLNEKIRRTSHLSSHVSPPSTLPSPVVSARLGHPRGGNDFQSNSSLR